MNATRFLRIAAVITLLYCAGHTAGAPWTPATAPEQLLVLEAMKSQSFEVEGVERTYWDFYLGFGVIISVFLLVQAVVLWQVGSLANANGGRIRSIIVAFLVAFMLNAALAWRYFFAVPAIMAIAISLTLVVALVLAGRARY
jgi:hypothetical protein